MKSFDESEKYNNYLDYWDHVKWLDNIVTINTTNVVKGTFEILYPEKGDEEYNEPKKELLAKLHRSKQHIRSIPGVKRRQCHGRCKNVKGPWKRI
jgi:hypothetical protein